MTNAAATLTVTFTKQGGGRIKGTAIGRMGSKLLIAYRIKSGEARERWIPASRYDAHGQDVSVLPAHRVKYCPAYTVDEPVRAYGHYCTTCGILHSPDPATIERRPDWDVATGFKRAKIGTEVVS